MFTTAQCLKSVIPQRNLCADASYQIHRWSERPYAVYALLQYCLDRRSNTFYLFTVIFFFFFFLSFIFHFFFLNRKAGMFSGFYVVTQNCKFCIVNCVFITLCINVTEDSGEVFHTQGIR